MPKNPDKFCSKFRVHDPDRTADEHIKIFEANMFMLQVQHEDVICRLFPYSLQDEAYYWFANLPAASINSWPNLKTAFLNRFRMPTTPSDLYRSFVEIRWEEGEMISTFNNRFQKAYSRQQAPYAIDQAAALPIYYAALDKLTSMFARRANPVPASLAAAYAAAVEVSTQLGQTTSGPLNHMGPVAMPNQIPMINHALANRTPVMNPVPSPAATQALVIHPGNPVAEMPPAQMPFLQSSEASKTKEDKDDIKELVEQMKKLTAEVTHLKN